MAHSSKPSQAGRFIVTAVVKPDVFQALCQAASDSGLSRNAWLKRAIHIGLDVQSKLAAGVEKSPAGAEP